MVRVFNERVFSLFIYVLLTLTAVQLLLGRSLIGYNLALTAAVGLAAIWLGEPLAYAMIGFAYAGAAMGRVLSLLFDAPPLRKVLVFGGIEAALAAWFLLANLG